MNKITLIKKTDSHKKHENCKSCKNCTCSNNMNELLKSNNSEIIDLTNELKEQENAILESNHIE